MVASAEPGLLKPSIEAEAEEAPKLILASFSPETIPAELKVTQDARQPPPPGRLFAYASAGGVPFARPSIKPKTTGGAAGNFPLYHDAEVVSAPEVDDDHPDEARYGAPEQLPAAQDLRLYWACLGAAVLGPGGEEPLCRDGAGEVRSDPPCQQALILAASNQNAIAWASCDRSACSA